MGRGTWAARLGRATAALGVPRDEQDAARCVVDLAVDLVPNASHAGLIIPLRRARRATFTATSPVAHEADALQVELGDGPLRDIQADPVPVATGAQGIAERWPRWGAEVAARGFGSALAVPLCVDGALLGVLTVYSSWAQAFAEPDDMELAVLFAGPAAHAVQAARTIGGLETAMQTRHVIGVAQGILMREYGLTLEGSFELLQRHSSETNTKLVEVARRIVATGRTAEALVES